MVKNFLGRNKSIFFIGGLTLIIFVGIIIASEVQRTNSADRYSAPKVVEMVETETPLISESAVAEFFSNAPESTSSDPDEKYRNVDETRGILRIEYKDSSFTPKNAKALVNQKAKIVNKGSSTISIVDKSNMYPELKTPVSIAPNNYIELRLTKTGLWTYEESVTKIFGSVFVLGLEDVE